MRKCGMRGQRPTVEWLKDQIDFQAKCVKPDSIVKNRYVGHCIDSWFFRFEELEHVPDFIETQREIVTYEDVEKVKKIFLPRNSDLFRPEGNVGYNIVEIEPICKNLGKIGNPYKGKVHERQKRIDSSAKQRRLKKKKVNLTLESVKKQNLEFIENKLESRWDINNLEYATKIVYKLAKKRVGFAGIQYKKVNKKLFYNLTEKARNRDKSRKMKF
jgi:hypothetical protein